MKVRQHYLEIILGLYMEESLTALTIFYQEVCIPFVSSPRYLIIKTTLCRDLFGVIYGAINIVCYIYLLSKATIGPRMTTSDKETFRVNKYELRK
jgi:hypothetical protein